MGRIYKVTFSAISISAVQDLFEINPGTNKPFWLLGCKITQSVSETSEQLRYTIERVTATFASGSGGGSAVVAKCDPGDSAAGFTAERNNTTRATGTKEILEDEGQNVINGWLYQPTPKQIEIFTNGQPCIIGLPTAPGAALTMSGVAYVEEVGG